MASFAFGLATATKNRDGQIIEAFFPTPFWLLATLWLQH